VSQVIFQTIVCLYVFFNADLFESEETQGTFFFNVLIWMNIWNMVSCRKVLTNEWNCFAGIHKNLMFPAVLAFECFL